jgi:hypothetical protein
MMLNIPEENLKKFEGPFLESEDSTYPEVVSLRSSFLTEIFKEQLIQDEINPQDFFEEISKIFIEKFINGDSDFDFTVEEFFTAHSKALLRTAIRDLRSEGIIDSIENIEGEEVIFLTESGKEYCTKNKLDE